MNDELLLKLKDAGFPIQQTCGHCGEGYATDVEPTLSELIAACGEGFSALWYENDVPRWCACTTGDDFISKEEQGATTEEAVANLYLALHPSE